MNLSCFCYPGTYANWFYARAQIGELSITVDGWDTARRPELMQALEDWFRELPDHLDAL